MAASSGRSSASPITSPPSPWEPSRGGYPAGWHALPSDLPHTIPLFLHIVGAAIAVYGVICVFGFANRTELNLGIFLLRAGFDMTPLLLALAAYAVIFHALSRLIRPFERKA